MTSSLFDVFSEIDPKFIEEAAEFSPVSGRRPSRKAIASAVAAAALAVAIVPTAIIVSQKSPSPQVPPVVDTPIDPDTPPIDPDTPPAPGDQDPPSAVAPMSLGETRTLASGTEIFYRAKTDHSVTISLQKKDDAPVYLRLAGRNGLNAYYASNDPRYAGEGVCVEDGLTFTVNGRAGEFPSAAGEYEIVIDYSPMRALCTSLGELYTSLCAFFL